MEEMSCELDMSLFMCQTHDTDMQRKAVTVKTGPFITELTEMKKHWKPKNTEWYV